MALTDATASTVLPTEYAGIVFRSRLEARWAVILDKVGARWQYEPEGYRLPSGSYLPDFLLPDLSCYLEIKPEVADQAERDRIEQLARELALVTGRTIFVAWGLPDPRYVDQNGPNPHVYSDYAGGKVTRNDDGWDNHYTLTRCPNCGSVGFVFEGRAERLAHATGCWVRESHKVYNGDDPLLLNAYEAAWRRRWYR